MRVCAPALTRTHTNTHEMARCRTYPWSTLNMVKTLKYIFNLCTTITTTTTTTINVYLIKRPYCSKSHSTGTDSDIQNNNNNNVGSTGRHLHVVGRGIPRV